MDKERAPQRVALALLAAMAVGCAKKDSKNSVTVWVDYLGCDGKPVLQNVDLHIADVNENGFVDKDQAEEMKALEDGIGKNTPKGFKIQRCEPESSQWIKCFSQCP